ncbi:hypothetical protein [Hugenholtzia roseola]|uniref:hypothetical protein n=1 Tax=Hugenholtzia roseola TaxID=1002 RepID=UPI00047AC37E|nr:hypothetical protein [Hugenholtzia roseola]
MTQKIKKLGLGILLLMLASFAPNKLPKKFTGLLDNAGLTFESPVGFKPTKIIENKQMNYEYAIKHKKENFEVRFAIRPLEGLLRNYREREKNKKQGEININPNTIYASLLEVTALNISGGQTTEIVEFDTQAVKAEFNADWGATTLVKLEEEFGQSYQYCLIVAIHKDDLGDAYCFFLANSLEQIKELSQPAFYSLKFK